MTFSSRITRFLPVFLSAFIIMTAAQAVHADTAVPPNMRKYNYNRHVRGDDRVQGYGSQYNNDGNENFTSLSNNNRHYKGGNYNGTNNFMANSKYSSNGNYYNSGYMQNFSNKYGMYYPQSRPTIVTTP